MIDDQGRLIRNLYCMLAYAFFPALRKKDRLGGSEDFDNIYDLAAALLAYGLSRRIQEGLLCAYIPRQESLLEMRGRIDMPGTVRLHSNQRMELSCEFDEFSADNIYNRIFKSTILYLLRPSAPADKRPSEKHRAELRRLLPLLESIGTVDPSRLSWSCIQPPPHNTPYTLLLYFCRLVWEKQLLSPDNGQRHRLPIFADEEAMARIFEMFVRNYYRRHHPGYHAESTRLRWWVEPTGNGSLPPFLPGMKTDITLRCGDRALIIDTKYYRQSLQKQWEAQTLRNSHVNQIFAYVYNYSKANPGVQVSGMLLYARTEEESCPVTDIPLGDWTLHSRVLDLNTPFPDIAAALDSLPQGIL